MTLKVNGFLVNPSLCLKINWQLVSSDSCFGVFGELHQEPEIGKCVKYMQYQWL